MIRSVHLHNKLKELTNTESVELDVNNPQELISGLRSQVKGFRKALAECPEWVIVLADKERKKPQLITPDIAQFPFNSEAEEIHIVPAIGGAGTGAEVFLIDFFYTAGMSWAASVAVAQIVIAVAVNIAVSAVSQALAPSPNTSDGGGRADERPSFLYNGAINVVEQGYAVPLVYGTHMTGSIQVSAGVDVAEIPYEVTETTPDSQPAVPPVEDWQWDPTDPNNAG